MALGWLWVETIPSLCSWSKKVSETHTHVWPFPRVPVSPALCSVSQMERQCGPESRREIGSLRWDLFVFAEFRLLFVLNFLQLFSDGCFQVNGTLVTCSNHMEVVKLIKCKLKWEFGRTAHMSERKGSLEDAEIQKKATAGNRSENKSSTCEQKWMKEYFLKGSSWCIYTCL